MIIVKKKTMIKKQLLTLNNSIIENVYRGI